MGINKLNGHIFLKLAKLQKRQKLYTPYILRNGGINMGLNKQDKSCLIHPLLNNFFSSHVFCLC